MLMNGWMRRLTVVALVPLLFSGCGLELADDPSGTADVTLDGAGAPSEGTQAAPLVLNLNDPYDGSVSVGTNWSYYRFTTTSAGLYTVVISESTNPVSALFTTVPTSGSQICDGMSHGASCSVVFNAATVVDFHVAAGYLYDEGPDYPSWFTIEVQHF